MKCGEVAAFETHRKDTAVALATDLPSRKLAGGPTKQAQSPQLERRQFAPALSGPNQHDGEGDAHRNGDTPEGDSL